MTLRRIWLELCWIFGYRAVLKHDPPDSSLVIYGKMGRTVGEHRCAVCHCRYWVVGNPKIKGHFSPVCWRRKCYIEYYSDPTRRANEKRRMLRARRAA